MPFSAADESFMNRALALAKQGEGAVEPNPMVGCVIVRDGDVIGEGYHQRFGEAHAEINAIQNARQRGCGANLGGDMFVTLEPCCHQGKTPPCADAVVQSGVTRVVIAMRDPFPKVDGGGIAKLREAGVTVEVGLGEEQAQSLNAPFIKRVTAGKPWGIAKWAMTLDGKIATHTGDSQWISNERSRAIVHKLRGRMDAVIVGIGTALKDDPLLTARPTGVRIPARIVVDTNARLPVDSQLANTIDQGDVFIAAAREFAESENANALAARGCRIIACDGETRQQRIASLLRQLGAMEFTNVLLEGGGELLGSCFDGSEIDEVHVFVAPKLIGGGNAKSPIAGVGRDWMKDAFDLSEASVEQLDGDIYIHGRLMKQPKE